MDDRESELLEKIRQQFDSAPYPMTPLDKSPKDDGNSLFVHNLGTPYYLRNQKVIETEGRVILDAGCGTGYKSLTLAEANPGAKIVGIDISEAAIKLAQQRLQHYGFKNAEFHVLSIENLAKLGLQFDYINCDEVLYLLSEPAVGLQAMKSVLKPEGIIRSNLHSSIQRFNYFRAQKVFRMMGLMDENPEELEINTVIETMKALKDGVDLKAKTWNSSFEEDGEQVILMNYLFQEDKGYTIPDIFTALRAADLEFISMVNWRHWGLMDLFKEPEDLPVFLAMSLPEVSVEEQLHLFELLHPMHRLLDFWCGHLNQAKSFASISEWTLSHWMSSQVCLHPQLSTPQVKEDLIDCITKHKPFEISRYITAPTTGPLEIDLSLAACLFPLWEGAQPFTSLMERWLKIRPVDLVTLEPMKERAAFHELQKFLSSLEVFLYVLLEHPEESSEQAGRELFERG